MNYKVILRKIMLSTLLVWLCIPVKASAAGQQLLTEPFLQCPTDTTVTVVWFTSVNTVENYIVYGKKMSQKASADTKKLTRMRSFDNRTIQIYRHEALATELPLNKTGNERVPYQVISDGVKSKQYYLQAVPQVDVSMKILLTSDCQLKEMSAANYQKVVETAGHIDAVFYAGDLVNIPDLAEEWFPLNSSVSFFSLLQGTADKQIHGNTYQGGTILQEAPIYISPGNHEFMGRYSTVFDLGLQFNDTMPASYGTRNQTFNTISFEEIFNTPDNQDKLYYAVTIGNIRLVVLNVTRMWRSNEVGTKSDYSEDIRDIGNPDTTSEGAIIFEPIQKGSAQFQWLQKEVTSEAYRNAGYRVVMFHHAPHGLGGNIVPPFTDPIRKDVYDNNGQLQQILYEYPKENDYLIRDLEPLLKESGTDLVLNGHSHLWNRFRDECGMNYLETSNVGNTYGAFDGQVSDSETGSRTSRIPSDLSCFDQSNYLLSGDPGGLKPVFPTICSYQQKPYIASNTLTVFSLFDTESGIIESYWFDTEKPDSEPVKFDSFQAKRIVK